MKIYMADTYGQKIHEVDAVEISSGYFTNEAHVAFGPAGSVFYETAYLSKDRDKMVKYLRSKLVENMNAHLTAMATLDKALRELQ